MKNAASTTPSIRSKLRGLALRVLRLALLFYVCLFLFTLFSANTLIFPAPAVSYSELPGQVSLLTADGLRLGGLWLPHPGARFTLLYSHGNGEDLGHCLPHFQHLRDLGFNVFAYDYRGYGVSEGKPNEKGVYQDIQTAWNYLTGELRIPPGDILLYGRSLGSGPSTWLASEEKCGGLILDSAYTSTFKTVLPWLWFPNDKFPNLSRLSRVNCPVLVIHGTMDRTIPFSHGLKLFAAAPEPKRHLWIEGAGHNDLHDLAGDRPDQAILDFSKLVESRADHQPSR